MWACAIIIPDFEAPNYHSWQGHQYDALARLIGEVRAKQPDVLIGCWGVGVVKSSFRIFDSIWEGKPTGVIDLTGAKQWREKYNLPEADLHSVFKRTIHGVETALNYYMKYFGFYNFHVLGMWQASQHQEIIEAATAWEMRFPKP